MPTEHPVLKGIDQRPQRQDSLTEQLWDLRAIAVRLGMYDADDWLRSQLPSY